MVVRVAGHAQRAVLTCRVLCCVLPTPHLRLQEHQQHRGAVSKVLFTPEGDRLLSCGADGGLCVYDVVQIYAPVKFLSAGVKDLKVRAACCQLPWQQRQPLFWSLDCG